MKTSRSLFLSLPGLLALITIVQLTLPSSSRAQMHSKDLLAPGPYKVGSQTFELIDTNRPTLPRNRSKALQERRLLTTVWYPSNPRPLEILRPSPTPAATESGPFPLIIYNHGFMSTRKEGLYLVEHLASSGYVVAAADFPLTNYSTEEGPQAEDVVNQPADVSFLIDTFLAWNQTSDHAFHGLIDPDRIALMGLSLGGMTTTLAAFHPRLRDPRVKVAISLAGPTEMFADSFFASPSLPFLMVAGTADALVDFDLNARALPERVPEGTLVTIREGSHTGFANFADPYLSWLDNPDAIGCYTVRRRVANVPNFLETLGGPAEGIRSDRRTLPCANETLTPALNPKRQHELTELAVTSFLATYLATDDETRREMGRFLIATFPAENPEISVESHIQD